MSNRNCLHFQKYPFVWPKNETTYINTVKSKRAIITLQWSRTSWRSRFDVFKLNSLWRLENRIFPDYHFLVRLFIFIFNIYVYHQPIIYWYLWMICRIFVHKFAYLYFIRELSDVVWVIYFSNNIRENNIIIPRTWNFKSNILFLFQWQIGYLKIQNDNNKK